MAGRQPELSKATLIRILGKEFSNIAHVPQQKNSGQIEEAPYAVNDFLHFLINNQINLLVIFKQYIKSKQIPLHEFMQFLQKFNYRGENQQALEIMVKFFLSSKDQSKVLLAKIVVYARVIEPTYGKNKAPQQVSKAQAIPHHIKRTLKKISDAISDRRWTKEELFAKLD